MSVDAQPGKRRPAGTRRRGTLLQQAIFAAVLDELRTVGYAKLTMEGVAASAGTGKAALYRRWASTDELVADALRSTLPDPAEIALVGEPRADIMALLLCIRDAMEIARDSAFRVVKKESAGESGPGLLQTTIRQRVLHPCRDLIRQVIARHVGPEHRDAVNERVVTVGPAMLMHYAITESEDIPDGYVTAIVDDVIMPLIR